MTEISPDVKEVGKATAELASLVSEILELDAVIEKLEARKKALVQKAKGKIAFSNNLLDQFTAIPQTSYGMYMQLRNELGRLGKEGKDESEEAEKLREKMDKLWWDIPLELRIYINRHVRAPKFLAPCMQGNSKAIENKD